MKTYKIENRTKYYLYWDSIKQCTFVNYNYLKEYELLGILEDKEVIRFGYFLTHNPKAKNLTLESAKELLKTFLDNQKY